MNPEQFYEQRQTRILQHLSSMMGLQLPCIPEHPSFQGNGFQLIPYLQLQGTDGKRRTIMAHIEGGYWIAKMHCEPEHRYDEVIRRLLLVVRAEEVSGKPRYIDVSDFMIAQLARIYRLFKDKIQVSDEVWTEVEEQLINYRYATFHEPMSENHKIIHLSSELVAVHCFPEACFYDGFTGKEKMKQTKQSISKFLERRLKYGWSEFDSTGYYNVDFVALLNMYDLQPDGEVRELARKSLNFMLVDLLHHSTNGYVGGARGRVKITGIAHSKAGVYWPLYVCTGFPDHVQMDELMEWSTAFFATSAFRPEPAIAMLASERAEPYEVKERNSLYSMPDDQQVIGSLKRYHYVTKDYVLGSIVQRDELEPYNFHRWLNGHQELSWSLIFANHPEAVVFSSHPGHANLPDWGMHHYWTGDTNCHCHAYVQHKNVLLGMNMIRRKEQTQQIHFYIPKHAFDRVCEYCGWLFLQSGGVIAAIKPEPGYYWTTRGEWAGKEIIVPASQSAFVVEMFELKQYSMEDLAPRMKNKELLFENGRAQYKGLSGITLELEADGISKVNGIAQNYSGYPKFSSKYVYSEWGSEQMKIYNTAPDAECWL